MKTRTYLTVVLIATGIIGATAASAQPNNPLHPSYFWDKTKVETPVQSNAGPAVVAITNPLHPGYFAAKATQTAFISTVALNHYAYVDNRNPLHPSYRRN